jgi:hypothetical protein
VTSGFVALLEHSRLVRTESGSVSCLVRALIDGPSYGDHDQRKRAYPECLTKAVHTAHRLEIGPDGERDVGDGAGEIIHDAAVIGEPRHEKRHQCNPEWWIRELADRVTADLEVSLDSSELKIQSV